MIVRSLLPPALAVVRRTWETERKRRCIGTGPGVAANAAVCADAPLLEDNALSRGQVLTRGRLDRALADMFRH